MAEVTADTLLIQFARAPQPGQVKTRMMPALSAQQASELHCELLLHSCRQLLASGLGPLELWVTGDRNHAAFGHCLELGVTGLRDQVGADLGQRMYHALRDGLARYRQVLLVGSDCPGIDSAYLRQAQAALRTAPVVFGPALDGGYVLLGATRVDPGLFDGIGWGGTEVLARSLDRAAGLGWKTGLLAPLADIDRPEDLPTWRRFRA